MSSYPIKAQLTVTSKVLDQGNLKSKIILVQEGFDPCQILKPFKKLAVVYYQVFKPDNTLLLTF